MVALPAVIPVTSPVELTLAIPEDAVDQLPPLTVDESAVFAPVQTEAAPEIEPALGNGLTVIGAVATLVPQLLVTL